MSELDISSWTVHLVRDNGDCLFESLHMALASIGYVYTISDLRYCVAKRTLDCADAEMGNALFNWITIFNDASKFKELSTMREYSHVANVTINKTHRTIVDISNTDRMQIFRQMMSHSYWGEELAIQTLERAMHCRFLIISLDDDSKHPKAMKPVEPMAAQIYLLLAFFRNKNHYCPMSYNGRFVFLRHTLPMDVKILFSDYL